MAERLMSDVNIAKTFLTVRENVCSGDKQDPMRKHLTVGQMEKYSEMMDKHYKGTNEN